MGTSIDMGEVLNAIMAEMKELRKAIVDGHTKQQAMEDKIFALESEKVERERVEEMEVEPQVQASQVQPEPTPIDVAEVNSKCLQEIEDQANLLLQMGKSCKVEAYKESRAMGVLEG